MTSLREIMSKIRCSYSQLHQARDSLALERDRANELESDKKAIADRLASLEMRAAQYVSEAESRYFNSQYEFLENLNYER